MRLVLTIVAFLSLLVMAPATASAQSWEDFYRIATESYNQGRYSEAVSAYRKAIQAAPHSATRAYLNCARAYNQLKQYAAAEQFYLWYSDFVPDDDKAKAELKAVRKRTKRSSGSKKIVSDSQAAALELLEGAIANGVYVDTDGGGALALYDVLLRTGYASPKLFRIQQDLAIGLVAESLAVATPPEGQPAPSLDRAGWDAVRERLSRAVLFADVVVSKDAVAALDSLALGWQQYLGGSYGTALEYFEEALAKDSSLLAAHWGRALSYVYTDTSADQAATFAALESVRASFGNAKRSPEPFASILEAKTLQSIGKVKDAAALLDQL